MRRSIRANAIRRRDARGRAAGKINIRIPGNAGHGRGYVVYGVAPPQGTLSLTNVAATLAGATPTAANNGTARLADIDVITGNSFTVQLNTTPVTLPTPAGEANPVRDVHADGDTAMIRIDGGLNLNGVAGHRRRDARGASVTASKNFTTSRTPGYVWNGVGERRHGLGDVRANDRRHAACRGAALRHRAGLPSSQRRHWR